MRRKQRQRAVGAQVVQLRCAQPMPVEGQVKLRFRRQIDLHPVHGQVGVGRDLAKVDALQPVAQPGRQQRVKALVSAGGRVIARSMGIERYDTLGFQGRWLNR